MRRFRQCQLPDWALIDRLIEAYEKHGSVYLRAGNELLASPEELKSAIESVSEAPESIDVLLKRWHPSQRGLRRRHGPPLVLGRRLDVRRRQR